MLAIAAGQAVCAEKWRVQYFYDKNHSSLTINDLAFPSPSHGVAVGHLDENNDSRPVSVVTDDGGAHWTVKPLKQMPISLFFLDDSQGWMVTPKGIWHTDEGGRELAGVAEIAEAADPGTFSGRAARLRCGHQQVGVPDRGWGQDLGTDRRRGGTQYQPGVHGLQQHHFRECQHPASSTAIATARVGKIRSRNGWTRKTRLRAGSGPICRSCWIRMTAARPGNRLPYPCSATSRARCFCRTAPDWG